MGVFNLSEGKARIGLALGGGAARGMAHIGVLSVLEEQGMPIDIITGISIGAIIGAIYAAGTDLSWLEKLAVTLNWDQLIDVTVPRMGFFKTEKLYQLLDLLCKHKQTEDLDYIYRAIAVDIQTGSEVVLDKGNVAKNALASASIPGIFLPQEVDGRLLVDGGIRSRVPIDPARQVGADIVIAVDVGSSVQELTPTSVIDIILQSIDIMQQEINVDKVCKADVVIRPDLEQVKPHDLRLAPVAIEAGRKAAQEKWPEIYTLLERAGRLGSKERGRYNARQSIKKQRVSS